MTPTYQHPVALITGASSGIGAATAIELARRGYAVALAARRRDDLDQVAGQIRVTGGMALPIPTDLRDRSQLETLVSTTEEQLGPIRVLVNNAGIRLTNRAWEGSHEQVDEVMQLNVFSHIQLTRLIAPHMIARKSGHIINIGSAAAYLTTPNNSLYIASKHALRGWNNALRYELLRHRVHVTFITPGAVRTAMNPKSRGFLMVEPSVVAQAIARVIDRPKREVVVPQAYRLLIWLDRLMPSLWEVLLKRMG